MPWFEDKGDHLILNLRVVPRASKDGIGEILGGALKIRIQAPPVEGKANAYLIRFLSRHWKVSKADIELVSGGTGRNKRIRISHPTDEIRKQLLSLQTD